MEWLGKESVMVDKGDLQRQESEIRGFIAESRSQFTGGGLIAVVWAALTAVAFILWVWVIPPRREAVTALWMAHNALGWIFTLVWHRWLIKKDGRVSLRDRMVLRVWAMVTLVLWLTLSILYQALPRSAAPLLALLTLFLAMGIFVTGLLSESTFSQLLGVVLAILTAAFSRFLPPGSAVVAVMVTVVAMGLIWGLGTWFPKAER